MILQEVTVKDETERVVKLRVLTVIQDTAVVRMENAKDLGDHGSHRKKKIIMGPRIGLK